MNLEHVACDLCGCDDYVERYRKPDNWLWVNQFRYPAVECTNCGLVYVNPRPTFKEMAGFYPEGYHDFRDDEHHRRRYELQFSYISHFEAKRVLDIGCAKGDWLNFIGGKWPGSELHGVDAFSNEVNNKEINFYRCLLPDANLPEEYFDLITSWAVFEHLHTPGAYFEVVSKVLRKGGKFVFLVTNSESCYGKYAFQEDMPRHLYHFSKKSLQQYAGKYGLSLDRVIFDDQLWDGRGWGTFRWFFARMAGVTWRNTYLKKYNVMQRFALKLGGLFDRIVFSAHWEAKLGRSGIMVVIFGK